MFVRTMIDMLYLMNELKKIAILTVASPFGVLALALMGLSMTGSDF